MIKVKVFWEFGECKAECDDKPGVVGSGKSEEEAVGDFVIKLELVAIELVKKTPVTD